MVLKILQYVSEVNLCFGKGFQQITFINKKSISADLSFDRTRDQSFPKRLSKLFAFCSDI